MFGNKSFAKIFLLIFFAKSIYAMEEASVSDVRENKKEIESLEILNQANQILDLRELAFTKVLKILQNDLTLKDNPDWLLENMPCEISDAFKKEIISLNSAALWYCFGDIAQTKNIELNSENFIKRLRFNNDLLIIFASFEEKNKFVIFDLVGNEVIVKGLIDIAQNSFSIIKSDYINEMIIKDESKIVALVRSSLFRKKRVGKGFSSIYDEEGRNFNYFDFWHYDDKLKRFKRYYIPLKNNEEPILDIDKSNLVVIFGAPHVFRIADFTLKGYHDCSVQGAWPKIRLKVLFEKEIAVTGSSDQSIKIWDLKTLECIKTIKLNCDIRKFKISGDGALILTRLSDKIAAVFDVETAKQIQAFSNDHEISKLLINEKKTGIAIASNYDNNSKIKICSIDSILNRLNIRQLTLIGLLYNDYKANNYGEIRSNSVWNQILKSFDPNLQSQIFKKFNLKISCNN